MQTTHMLGALGQRPRGNQLSSSVVSLLWEVRPEGNSFIAQESAAEPMPRFVDSDTRFGEKLRDGRAEHVREASERRHPRVRGPGAI